VLKTIRSWFQSDRRDKSKASARSRLSFVLVQDRTGLNNDELASFKKEMIEVIERYFVIDESGFDIEYKRQADTTTLVINSPIVVRRQDMPVLAGVGSEAKRGESKRKPTRAVVAE
jgi:cell division topological specificity factor